MLMVSRPLVVLLLLMVLVVVSQLDLRIEVTNRIEERKGVDMKKQWESMRREAVQQRIILLQQSKIQSLQKLVSSLQQQLGECQSNNSTTTPDSS